MFLKDIKVGAKIVATLTILSGIILGIGITGIDGMQRSGDAIGKIYQNQLVPVSELAEINDLISEAFIQLAISSQHDTRLEESRNHTHPVTFHTDQVEGKLRKADEVWRQYTSQSLTDKEKIPAEKLEVAQKKILPMVKKSVELLKSGEYSAPLQVVEFSTA